MSTSSLTCLSSQHSAIFVEVRGFVKSSLQFTKELSILVSSFIVIFVRFVFVVQHAASWKDKILLTACCTF